MLKDAFARWSDKGIFEQLHQFVIDEPDLEHLIADAPLSGLILVPLARPRKEVTRRLKPWVAAEAASAPKSILASNPWAILYS